jgi:hypothetical protein
MKEMENDRVAERVETWECPHCGFRGSRADAGRHDCGGSHFRVVTRGFDADGRLLGRSTAMRPAADACADEGARDS